MMTVMWHAEENLLQVLVISLFFSQSSTIVCSLQERASVGGAPPKQVNIYLDVKKSMDTLIQNSLRASLLLSERPQQWIIEFWTL